ncbi:RNA polymerase sigma factor [Quadrisphaera sp. DSM 44207]|uniref:RNA polymerase sigma factor n=1 Tax=Quadrisphaera sp. DSM 44207 TaxID=1881057 RepID=UPI00087F734C|nr:RNA polymerase sigma factor [Quadrisphaera sp. DSM 44207]SDQ85704.1 RNA polymerase sigma-70 factor, ECF subfamily [Quadrisphaera sp. DSM 44207]
MPLPSAERGTDPSSAGRGSGPPPWTPSGADGYSPLPPDPAPELEAALVEHAREGDEDAFAQLVRLHQDRAYAVALRMTGRPQDAQDVVQEALLYAWRGLPRYRGEARFGTWLIRIVINRCHDLRRRAREALPLPEDDGAAGTAPGADAVVVAAGRRDAAIEAIARLPFDQRAALVLHTFGGWSHAEVARTLGTTEGAVKVRVHRARRALLEQLEEWR